MTRVRFPRGFRWPGSRFTYRPGDDDTLDLQQRVALNGTVRELANLVAAAFVLGQFVGERRFSWSLVLAGAAAWIALVVFGLVLERRRR